MNANVVSYEGNQQGLFDDVVKHLRTQKVRSFAQQNENDTVCLYRGPNGLKCAIGGILPDELYFPEMEGASVLKFYQHNSYSPNEDRYLKVHAFLGPSNEKLGNHLQLVHDSKFRFEEMEKEFKEIAEKYGLVYKEPAHV